MKKKIALSVIAISLTGMLVGCGSSSSSDDSATTSNTSNLPASTVKVVDGYVIGANVCDANNVCATTDGSGAATASYDLNTTLTSTAGYIDVNNNQQIDDSDIQLPDTFTLKTPAGATVITPITDLIANGADKTKLAQILGVSEEDLLTDPIATNNVALAKAIQIVYAVKIDGKEADFINQINSYTPESATEANTTTTTNTEAETTTPESSQTTVLPVLKADEANVTTTQEDTTTATADITTFANLAKNVVSDDVKNFIDTVVTLDVENVADIETQIADTKKEITVNAAASVQMNTEATATTDTTASAEATANTEVSAETNDTTATATTDTTAETNTTETTDTTTQTTTETTETTTSSSVLPAI